VIQKRWALGLVLVSVGLIGLLVSVFFQPRIYSMDHAVSISERHLTSLNSPDLAIGEIMEFEQNFYVIYYEKSTGIGGFEMLIDKDTGRIFPEYGPNSSRDAQVSAPLMKMWKRSGKAEWLTSFLMER